MGEKTFYKESIKKYAPGKEPMPRRKVFNSMNREMWKTKADFISGYKKTTVSRRNGCSKLLKQK